MTNTHLWQQDVVLPAVPEVCLDLRAENLQAHRLINSVQDTERVEALNKRHATTNQLSVVSNLATITFTPVIAHYQIHKKSNTEKEKSSRRSFPISHSVRVFASFRGTACM